ncbi:MAG: hypothetical protein HY587_07755 [Candidatus Omnitrophica bacterium]|nr:hypothetical protein [Candidatus Omnitrophota bacterium]
MSANAAKKVAAIVALSSLAMLGFVVLRTEMLERSYAIQECGRELRESREHLRVLQFEVGQKKALANLDSISNRLSSSLSRPARVNHLVIQNVQTPVIEPQNLAFPQNFFSLFSVVPEAFAKSDDKTS